MLINKNKILLVLFAGVLFGGAFAISAFTEPSSGPGSTTSYVPINVGPTEQVRIGKLGVGDGTNQAGELATSENSLWVSGILGSDSLNARQNASLIGNVIVKEDAIVAGAIRVPQLYIPGNYSESKGIQSLIETGGNNTNCPTDGPCYLYNDDDTTSGTTTTPSIYFDYGITTNLGMGTCVRVTNAPCPAGSILSKYNPSTGVSSCRKINPAETPTSLSSC